MALKILLNFWIILAPVFYFSTYTKKTLSKLNAFTILYDLDLHHSLLSISKSKSHIEWVVTIRNMRWVPPPCNKKQRMRDFVYTLYEFTLPPLKEKTCMMAEIAHFHSHTWNYSYTVLQQGQQQLLITIIGNKHHQCNSHVCVIAYWIYSRTSLIRAEWDLRVAVTWILPVTQNILITVWSDILNMNNVIICMIHVHIKRTNMSL